MSDPVYRRLREDLGELLTDLWHLFFPVNKPARVVPSSRRRL
ncbi:hypothetical protein [Oleiharenicola lentus]|nr:hypothetical protein [Oleiharenicola lentus]